MTEAVVARTIAARGTLGWPERSCEKRRTGPPAERARGRCGGPRGRRPPEAHATPTPQGQTDAPGGMRGRLKIWLLVGLPLSLGINLRRRA